MRLWWPILKSLQLSSQATTAGRHAIPCAVREIELQIAKACGQQNMAEFMRDPARARPDAERLRLHGLILNLGPLSQTMGKIAERKVHFNRRQGSRRHIALSRYDGHASVHRLAALSGAGADTGAIEDLHLRLRSDEKRVQIDAEIRDYIEDSPAIVIGACGGKSVFTRLQRRSRRQMDCLRVDVGRVGGHETGAVSDNVMTPIQRDAGASALDPDFRAVRL